MTIPRLVTKLDDVHRIVERVYENPDKAYTYDFETLGTRVMKLRPAGIGIGWGPEKQDGSYILTEHDTHPSLHWDRVFPVLKPLLEDASMTQICHNQCFDGTILRRYDIKEHLNTYDTMVMCWLLNTAEPNGLKEEILRRYGYQMKELKDFCRMVKVSWHPDKIYALNEVDIESMREYAIDDVIWDYRLWQDQRVEMQQDPRLEKLYHELYREVLEILIDMQINGSLLDLNHLKKMENDVSGRMSELIPIIFNARKGQDFAPLPEGSDEATINTERKKIPELQSKWLDRNTLRPLMYQYPQLAHKIFNPNSVNQLNEILFKEMKLKPIGEAGKSGYYSVDSDVLLKLKHKDKTGMITALLEYKQLSKLLGTYLIGLQEVVDEDGRVRTRFNPTLSTGRLSCVSGETLLQTSRGTFRFDEYKPQDGDLVLTHTGQLKPIVRKIYKGMDKMFRVCLTGGSEITATAEHRVLTPSGWKSVGELTVESEVYNVSIQNIPERPQEHSNSDGALPFRQETYSRPDSDGTRDYVSQCTAHRSYESSPRETESRAVFEVFSEQVQGEEPYVGQEWFAPSQLRRRGIRRSRVSSSEDWKEVCLPSQEGNGRSSWVEGITTGIRRSSHQWRQAGQQVGQSGVGDAGGSFIATSSIQRVERITFMGEMGVWDVEVADDHSYACSGFLNHNSSEPNLQNIPSRTEIGQEVRAGFVVPEGRVGIVIDYSNIEVRVAAHVADEVGLQEAFRNGYDPHSATAKLAFPHIVTCEVHEVKKKFPFMRAGGKTLNFAILYQSGPETVRDQIIDATNGEFTPSLTEVKQMIEDYFKNLPAIRRFILNQKRLAHANKEVRTILGRPRHLPEIDSPFRGIQAKAERVAVNAPIQGSAADIMFLGMRNAKRALVEKGWYGTKGQGRIQLNLQVHDELFWEADESISDEASKIIQDAMENAVKLRVPIVAEPGFGPNWKTAK